MKRAWLLLAGLLGAAALAAPPQLNLLVEVRAVRQLETVDTSGGFVVDTQRGATSLRGDIRVQTGREAGDAVEQVLVLNGGSAALRVSRLLPLPTGEWLHGGIRGAGVAQSRQWVDVGSGFQVRPQWPGGSAAVTVQLVAQAGGGTTAQTEIALPLGEWTAFARSGDTALHLRVSLPSR